MLYWQSCAVWSVQLWEWEYKLNSIKLVPTAIRGNIVAWYLYSFHSWKIVWAYVNMIVLQQVALMQARKLRFHCVPELFVLSVLPDDISLVGKWSLKQCAFQTVANRFKTPINWAIIWAGCLQGVGCSRRQSSMASSLTPSTWSISIPFQKPNTPGLRSSSGFIHLPPSIPARHSRRTLLEPRLTSITRYTNPATFVKNIHRTNTMECIVIILRVRILFALLCSTYHQN